MTLDYLLGKKSVDELPNSYNMARSFDCTMHLPNGNTSSFNTMRNEDIYIAGEKATWPSTAAASAASSSRN